MPQFATGPGQASHAATRLAKLLRYCEEHGLTLRAVEGPEPGWTVTNHGTCSVTATIGRRQGAWHVEHVTSSRPSSGPALVTPRQAAADKLRLLADEIEAGRL